MERRADKSCAQLSHCSEPLSPHGTYTTTRWQYQSHSHVPRSSDRAILSPTLLRAVLPVVPLRRRW